MVNDEMLAAINKTATEVGIPVKIVRKIYEEQINYVEFMMSQFNMYEPSSQMNFKIPYICNFYVRIIHTYLRNQKHKKSAEYDKYVMNETKRIDKLLNNNKKYVRYLQRIRRRRKTKWGFISDQRVQGYMEKRFGRKKTKSS